MSEHEAAKVDPHLRCCGCCGLLQRVPPVPARARARCARCRTEIPVGRSGALGNQRAGALALSALLLYPLAVTLPILEIEKFGHHKESSIVEGVVSLLAGGQWFLGVIVLLCSIVLPLGKLLCLAALSTGAKALQQEHRAFTYHLLEWTGRWGMLDVLLVAVLVAALKLGDLVEVQAGEGAVAFCIVVVLSLLASAVFEPHLLWRDEASRQAGSDRS